MKTIALLAMLITSTAALAEPIRLVCDSEGRIDHWVMDYDRRIVSNDDGYTCPMTTVSESSVRYECTKAYARAFDSDPPVKSVHIMDRMSGEGTVMELKSIHTLKCRLDVKPRF